LLILALEKVGLATDVRHGTPHGKGSFGAIEGEDVLDPAA
jgi:hypothetical protein